MHRTEATLVYRRSKNIRAVQLRLGDTKLESTVRYRCIEVDDALEIAEQAEVSAYSQSSDPFRATREIEIGARRRFGPGSLCSLNAGTDYIGG